MYQKLIGDPLTKKSYSFSQKKQGNKGEGWCQKKSLKAVLRLFLTLFRTGQGCKKASLFKICHTYPNPTMMKLGTVIPYLRKIQKTVNHVTHAFSSAVINIFSPEISNFCSIKKYRYILSMMSATKLL